MAESYEEKCIMLTEHSLSMLKEIENQFNDGIKLMEKINKELVSEVDLENLKKNKNMFGLILWFKTLAKTWSIDFLEYFYDMSGEVFGDKKYFAEHKDMFIKILSDLVYGKTIYVRKNMFIKPTTNTNGHNYTIGNIYATYEEGLAMAMSATEAKGNYLTFHSKSFKMATEEEIKAFLKANASYRITKFAKEKKINSHEGGSEKIATIVSIVYKHIDELEA